jgi:signal transduction histidine kinase
MSLVEPEFAASQRDPRLAAQLADLATGATPAWLWSADGSQILWANAVGAAIFGAANTSQAVGRRISLHHRAAGEIVRLAASLPPSGQARLERLRGFGASFGGALTCVCSRVALAEGAAVLVAATERAGPQLPLSERIGRLFAGRDSMLAAFTADGILLYATEAARTRLAGASTLPALGIAEMAAKALSAGSASGTTTFGPVTVDRLGSDASAVLVAEFGVQPNQVRTAETPAEKTAPAGSLPAPPVANTPVPRAASGRGHDEPERRHPLRFVWQMDDDGRFAVGSDEFVELMGPRTTAAFGRLWSEIAAELKLDPENQIARAVATQETWSGVTVSWPVDDGGERLSVELSGLPVFDRDRTFRGYRGFGVCRDLERINHLLRARRERTIGLAPQPQAPRETEASLAEAQPRTERPTLNVVPAAANVVPFRQGMAVEPNAPTLSPIERKAFRELTQELTARLRSAREDTASDNGLSQLHIELQAGATELVEARPVAPGSEPVSGGGLLSERSDAAHPHAAPAFEPALLDRIPLGVLIYRHGGPHDALLYANRYFLELSGHESLGALAATGLDNLFAEPGADAFSQTAGAQSLSILTRDGARRLVEGRLFTIPWGGVSALALILTNGEAEERRRANAELLAAAQNEIRDLKVHVESFKKAEADLLAATREAQKAAASKAEFVAKVSHEIRTPLNAITGFAEVIMAERFGPIGNERYAEYLKDIHGAGLHLVSLLNDLLDLSKIETGQLDLSFANISLNDLTQQCVGIMQPQASRARIIIRTSLMPGLPQVVADERSLRQIVLNLLSNSIRFTGPGGQVIVSTAFADSGEAVLRVRDTGVGMSEKDVEAALEPFRQTATAGSWGSGGTGLGLPLTKALAEANRAHFSIKTEPNAGTLIEVAFPPTRVVAH